MKIIVLKGPCNTGKTTTMGLVYNALIGEAEFIESREQEGGDVNDFSCVIKYKGKSVGLFTMGDYVNPLKRAIREYCKKSYDVMICAVSDGTYEGCNVKEEISKHHPTIIEKAVEKEHSRYDSANEGDADKVLAELSKIL